MDFTKISNHDLLVRVDKLARTERKITHLILWHLVEVESRRLHLEIGYPSLFKYMTAHLGYSEDAAYRRIQAARLLKNVRHLEEPLAKSLESGALNLTQLQQVQKCLNKDLEKGGTVSGVHAEKILEQTAKVLEQIQNKSSFETQKILAVEFNQPIQIHEKLKPQQDNSVRVELTLTEKQWADLQHVKERLSHALPNQEIATVISYLAKSEIKKRLGKDFQKDDANKLNQLQASPEVRRVELTGGKKISDEVTGAYTRRKNIKITTRRILLSQAQHRCEYIHPKAGRCQSKHLLQLDHLVPVAFGGSEHITNLRVLCQAHNLAEARRMGITKF
ncbi:HNH endonuclease [Bdellovibrio sp. HCB274]|uniref:HNH endonuclease n=1 Tax=Bdellovibrio sp. HCB274 TaxID=3394361 RepID=UPI0039B5D5DE